jgi:ankyrin repeat protein
MNIVSINDYYIATYEYFLTKFIKKTIFTRILYINLLKNNLLISLKNNNSNTISGFILTKLQEARETINFTSNDYKDIFIDLITKKNIKSIELFLTNGFSINTVETELLSATALTGAIKIKSMAMIRLLITHGANIASNNYNVLHYALKHKSQTLAHFIKDQLVKDNKSQLYLDWEQNAVLKAKYQALLVV